MNHDYTHCLDASEDCPDDCFRKAITMDIRKKMAKGYTCRIIASWANLKGTEECLRGEQE